MRSDCGSPTSSLEPEEPEFEAEPSPGDLWTWTKEAARGLPARSGLLLWTLVSYYNRVTGRCDPGLREFECARIERNGGRI